MKEKLLAIINHYQVSHQLKKLSEEILEFQEAIINCKIFDDFTDRNMLSKDYGEIYKNNRECFIKHIEEEFADVCVMLEQFKAYYDLDNEKIIEIMEQKINRQLDRISKEE